MPSGLEIISPLGRVLIDANFSNLRLVRTGTSYAASGWGGTLNWRNEMNTVDTTCPSGNPFVIVRPGTRWISSQIYIDGNLGFFSANNDPDGLSKAYGFEYAVFDYLGGDGELGNAGLQVFKENGEIAFDSRYRHLQVRGIASLGSFEEYTGPGSEKTASHVFLNNAWYLLGTVAGGRLVSFEGFPVWYAPMFRQTSSGTVAYTLSPGIAPSFGLAASNTLVVCDFTP